MGKIGGFMEYDRVNAAVICEEERIKNFNEFHGNLSLEEEKKQAARCMDCGIPFCQAGKMISGMASGCPLNNLVPEVSKMKRQLLNMLTKMDLLKRESLR